MLNNSGDMHLACADIDKKQHMKSPRPQQSPDGFGKKIASPQRLEMPLDKIIPAALFLDLVYYQLWFWLI